MKKIKQISIILLFIIIFFSICTNTFAKTLNIDLKSSAEKIEVGDSVKVTVDWNEGMQAADFKLEFDNKKLEYVGCDIDSTFTAVNDNKITVAWFSDNDVDKTKMEFEFKAKKCGNSKISLNIDGGFANGKLEMPDEYKINDTTIEIIGGNNWGKTTIIVVIGLVIIFLIFIIYKKNIGGKRK